MPLSRFQRRIDGTRMCQACVQFELDCWPYVHLLLSRDVSQKLRRTAFTLYPNFASLCESANAGCDICLMWRKALLNGCYSQAAQEALHKSTLPVQLEPPTEVRSTTGLDISVVSPIRATVKITHQALRDRDLKDQIVEDDIYSIELARQSGQVVRQVVGQLRYDVHLCATIELDPLSDVLWRRISRWMDHCVSTHSSCRKNAPREDLPARLIHVLDESTIRVVDSSELTGDIDYIALSYCWGGGQIFKLDADHEVLLRQGASRRIFPPTIKDAFSVCQFLKISYLWIDALCIRQNDSGDDFKAESRRMDKIYGSAKVTLVVSSAKSVMDGFLHPRAAEDLKINPRKIRFVDGRLILQRKGLAEVRAKSPLATRGWSVQEELLSRRLIYCTTHGIYWSCAQIEFAEHGNHLNLHNEGFEFDESVTILDPHAFINRVDPLFAWDQMIDQYSSRDLTIPQDRLPAVRGLAALIEQRSGTRYLFGMWSSRLPSQLLWVAASQRIAEEDHEREDLTSWRGATPSWSWASTLPLQAIRMPGPELSHSSAKLLEICDLNDVLCLRLEGRIRPLLQGHAKSTAVSSDQDNGSGQIQKSLTTSSEQTTWSVNDSESEIWIETAGMSPVVIQLDRKLAVELDELVCFEINYQGFLLLEASEANRYKRVGCSQVHEDANFFAHSETGTIDLM